MNTIDLGKIRERTTLRVMDDTGQLHFFVVDPPIEIDTRLQFEVVDSRLFGRTGSTGYLRFAEQPRRRRQDVPVGQLRPAHFGITTTKVKIGSVGWFFNSRIRGVFFKVASVTTEKKPL